VTTLINLLGAILQLLAGGIALLIILVPYLLTKKSSIHTILHSWFSRLKTGFLQIISLERADKLIPQYKKNLFLRIVREITIPFLKNGLCVNFTQNYTLPFFKKLVALHSVALHFFKNSLLVTGHSQKKFVI
jgi:hypothetical protein